jgi:hypothetical protein
MAGGIREESGAEHGGKAEPLPPFEVPQLSE